MAVPERCAPSSAQQAPLEEFTVNDLCTQAVEYLGHSTGSVGLRPSWPNLASANEVLQCLIRSEERRAGCSLEAVNELRRGSKLTLNYTLHCEYGRHRGSTQRRRAKTATATARLAPRTRARRLSMRRSARRCCLCAWAQRTRWSRACACSPRRSSWPRPLGHLRRASPTHSATADEACSGGP